MTYLPLARKYRPQTFADLVGQTHVTTTLTRALESKRVAQAYLFAGMRGVGKTSAARILAKCLNCAKGPTATPCNRCDSCAQIAHGNSLDVIEIDGASNRGIDEIRSLRETVPFAPTSGAFRIYIIDEVHMLTTEAFNALLKTLEEPPAHVKFIFATTAVTKVPATILSRCQRFDFRRLEAATMVEVLKKVARAEKVQAEEAALYAIARAAEGSLRDAEVVLEQLASFVQGTITEADVAALLGTVESEALAAWTQAILDHDAPKALAALHTQLDQGKDAPQLLASLLRHVRNLTVLSSTKGAPSRDALLAQLIDEPAERLKRLDEQADRVSPPEGLLWLQVLAGAYELVRRSPMASMILELVVIKLSTREPWQSLEQISRRLEQLSAGSVTSQRTASTVPPAVSAAPGPSAPPASAPQAADATTPARSVTAPSAPSADVMTAWPVFLERLAAQKMSLAAYLADAKPLALEGHTLTIGLPGFALHQEVLSVAENRRLIVGLLSELHGATLTVQYATLPASSESAQASAASPGPVVPPVVQEIVNLFNATILDQPRTNP